LHVALPANHDGRSEQAGRNDKDSEHLHRPALCHAVHASALLHLLVLRRPWALFHRHGCRLSRKTKLPNRAQAATNGCPSFVL
jgi:hypothetical protein